MILPKLRIVGSAEREVPPELAEAAVAPPPTSPARHFWDDVDDEWPVW